MNRRSFLKTTGLAAAAILTSRGALAKALAGRPNLLIIHTDEHNFRTLGCYRKLMPKDRAEMWGPTVCQTPHIDWLADNGAVATRFYATTPVCSPSRAAFVSGRYPQNTPVVTNGIPMADGTITFAEILRKSGYATGYAGKWHIDGGGKPQWGPKRQFGFADNRYMFNRGHWKKLEDTPNGPRVKGGNNYSVAGADAKSFTTDFLADKTVNFITTHKGEPFCYMVSIPDPHGPNSVRPPYDTMYAGKPLTAPATMSKPAVGLPSWGTKQGKFSAKQMEQYYGMVKCIDDNVGKILTAVRKAGLIDKTIILFTSDHGDLCGEHGRHNKGVPYEGSAKVPFVLYYPGKVKAGAVVNQALGCVDFLPTILGMMGVKTAGAEQGRNAAALFTGAAPADWNDVAIFRSTGQAAGWLAAATARHKLVVSSNSEPWLFDMEKDPHELKNFFTNAACRETVRSLSRQLLAYCKTYTDPRIESPRIKADLTWGAEGTEKYTPAELPDAKTPAAGGGKRRKKRKAPK